MVQTYNHTINDINFTIEDNAIKTFPKLSHSNTDIESGDFKLFINAVEIDWNGAQLVLPQILGGNRTINRTEDLLKLIVEIANKLSNPEPVDIPVITLNPNTTQTIRITTSNSDDFKEITATITNGNASNISWSISPSNMQGTTGKTFKLNKTTGSNVTITANDSTPNQGTLKDLTTSEPTQNLIEGQISLSTGFNAGADKDYQCTLVASYPNASDVQLIIKCKVISSTSANNYIWHYDGVPSSLTYELDGNHTTITLKNTTNSDILVPANAIYVTNEDASNTVYSPQFTIPGKTSLITPEVTFNNPLSTSLDYQQQTSLEVLFTYNGINVNGTLYLSTNKTELNITNPNINVKISHSNNWDILIRNDNNTSEDQTIAKGNITKLPFTFIPSDTNTYNTVTGYIKANQAITLRHQQQETTYTVQFNNDGGSVGAPSMLQVTEGAQITLPSYTGSKSGYQSPTKWIDMNTQTAYNFGATYTVTQNTIFKVQWIPVTYTVTVNVTNGTPATQTNPSALSGSTIVFPITPNSGYQLPNTVSGATVDKTNSRIVVSNVNSNMTINVVCEPIPQVYYWYVGTTKPTSLSDASTVTSYPAEQTFTNPSTTEKCYVFVLTNSNKTVNMYDPADPDDALLKAEDTSTISGYKITYVSADGSTPFKIAKGGSVIIRIS